MVKGTALVMALLFSAVAEEGNQDKASSLAPTAVDDGNTITLINALRHSAGVELTFEVRCHRRTFIGEYDPSLKFITGCAIKPYAYRMLHSEYRARWKVNPPLTQNVLLKITLYGANFLERDKFGKFLVSRLTDLELRFFYQQGRDFEEKELTFFFDILPLPK